LRGLKGRSNPQARQSLNFRQVFARKAIFWIALSLKLLAMTAKAIYSQLLIAFYLYLANSPKIFF
jgi:hypothetical protein